MIIAQKIKWSSRLPFLLCFLAPVWLWEACLAMQFLRLQPVVLHMSLQHRYSVWFIPQLGKATFLFFLLSLVLRYSIFFPLFTHTHTHTHSVTQSSHLHRHWTFDIHPDDDPENPSDFTSKLDYSYALFVAAIGPVVVSLAFAVKLTQGSAAKS